MKANLAILVLAGCILCSCKSHDPLQSFKAVVSLLDTEFHDCYPPIEKVSDASAIRFNVEKTTSLVSPYIGTLDYLRVAAGDPPPEEIQFSIHFAFQDDRWVLQNISAIHRNEPSRRYPYFENTEGKCWRAALAEFY